jgi:hypothetical protein
MTDPKTRTYIDKATGISSNPDLSHDQNIQIQKVFQIFDREKKGVIDGSQHQARRNQILVDCGVVMVLWFNFSAYSFEYTFAGCHGCSRL